jgi:hypothetical protein
VQELDATTLAAVAGGVTAILWFLNGKHTPDSGVAGVLGRVFVALAIGAVIGGAVYGFLYTAL